MVRINAIYTRGGDAGQTHLADGSRVAKTHLRMQACGDIDEANSVLGFARGEASGALEAALARIQNDLFDLGSDVASPQGVSFSVPRMVEAQWKRLEAEIDAATAQLEPLTSFILPGGSVLSRWLHLARTVTRRAERQVVALMQDETINPEALRYLNRLSDWCFAYGRLANNGGKDDILWVPAANRSSP